jgi:hypothetical protein
VKAAGRRVSGVAQGGIHTCRGAHGQQAGSGWPALWSHSNVHEATHDWIRGEFGGSAP